MPLLAINCKSMPGFGRRRASKLSSVIKRRSSEVVNNIRNRTHGLESPHRQRHVDLEPFADYGFFLHCGAAEWTSRLSANSLGYANLAINRWQKYKRSGRLLDLVDNDSIRQMNVVCVRHKTRGQCDDPMLVRLAEQGAISLDILTRVGLVTQLTNVLADVPEPTRKVLIEVAEHDSKAIGQKCTDRALACSTRAYQSNHRTYFAGDKSPLSHSVY